MNDEKELIYHILQYMLNQHFKSKSNMAKELGLELRTIQKIFSQFAKNESKGGSVVLEKILVYCSEKGISIDEIIKAFGQRGKTDNKRIYVDFPCPEIIDEETMPIYQCADEYVQSVASYICPHCNAECHCSKGDQWLWRGCLVSRISMMTLSHIVSVKESKRFSAQA